MIDAPSSGRNGFLTRGRFLILRLLSERRVNGIGLKIITAGRADVQLLIDKLCAGTALFHGLFIIVYAAQDKLGVHALGGEESAAEGFGFFDIELSAAVNIYADIVFHA